MIPDDLRYTAEHEWVRPSGGTVRVGITDFAQDSLGDIVFVELPESGRAVTAGESVGELESTKSVSDLYSPVAGTVTARNDAVVADPALVNTDPYGEGWLLEIELADPSAVDGLMDAAAYEKATSEG
ncbi:MAG TPA: glycine cleavage system protein GcvH [Actinocatenispora sp.]